jgi:hypothetical protein
MKLYLTALALFASGCAGAAYLPNQPGGGASDISGPEAREAWLADHPETPDSISAGVTGAYFVTGMTQDEINVITNPERLGTTANGYWRRDRDGNELRLHWFVSNERMPFEDGRKQLVCELVLVDDTLDRIRYCPPPASEDDSDGT